jgi:Spy/CpxP family protein refolding chaperone
MQRGWKNAALTIAATLCAAGSALAQGFGFGPPMGGGAMLLQMPAVQTELKLTDEQKAKLGALRQRLREERQGAFEELRGQGPEAFQKKMAEWRTSEDKQVSAILDTDQQKRFHQLQLQERGASAVLDKPLADALKLTDEQRTKIQAVLDEQRQSMRSLFGGPGGPGGFGGPPPGGPGGFGGPPPGGGPDGPGGPPPDAGGPGGPGGPPPDAGPGGPGGPGGFDPQAMRSRIEKVQKQADEHILALLTDDQKKQWQEMLGAPFTFPAFRGPGGPGGPGGPPAGFGPGGPPPGFGPGSPGGPAAGAVRQSALR